MRVEEFGFRELEDSFARAERDIGDKANKVTKIAMAKIKKGAKRRVSGHRHLTKLGYSFTYDVTQTRDLITGEVGADINRGQGALDHLIENGTDTSEPIPHWAPEADIEVPIWLKYLEDAAAEALDA